MLDRKSIEPEGMDEWHYSSPPVELNPGRYRLEIRDGRRSQAVDLVAVPGAQLPPPPADLLPGSDNTDVRETLYALWLAAQDSSWVLEAYQRAAALAERHPPAQMLRSSLERGERPPLPEAP